MVKCFFQFSFFLSLWMVFLVIILSSIDQVKCTPKKAKKSAPAIVAIEFVNGLKSKNPASISTVYKYTSKRTVDSSIGNYGDDSSVPKRFEIYPYSQQDIPPLQNSNVADLGHVSNIDLNHAFYDHPTDTATHLVPVILVRLNSDYLQQNQHPYYHQSTTHSSPQPSNYHHHDHQQHQQQPHIHYQPPTNHQNTVNFDLQHLIAKYLSQLPAMMLLAPPPQPQIYHQHSIQAPHSDSYLPRPAIPDSYTKAYASYKNPEIYSEEIPDENADDENNHGQFMYIVSAPNSHYKYGPQPQLETDVYYDQGDEQESSHKRPQSVSHSYFYQY